MSRADYYGAEIDKYTEFLLIYASLAQRFRAADF